MKFTSHDGSAAVGAADFGKPGALEHCHGAGEHGRRRWGSRECRGVDRVTVEDGTVVLAGPLDRVLEELDTNTAAAMLAAHHEARHPPCVRVVVEDASQRAVASDARQRVAWHHPSPPNRIVGEVGNQTDRHQRVFDLLM